MSPDETMAFVGSADVDIDTPPPRSSADSVADSARAAVNRAISGGMARLSMGSGGRTSGNGGGGEDEELCSALTGRSEHRSGARAAAGGVLASRGGGGGGERHVEHLDQGEIIDGDEEEEVLVEADAGGCGPDRYEAVGRGERACGMEGDMD